VFLAAALPGQVLASAGPQPPVQPLYDPATTEIVEGTQFATYGSSSGYASAYKNVPVFVHGDKAAGDIGGLETAMPTDALPASGIPRWADASGGFWAPSVVYNGSRYMMFLTYKRAAPSNQRCIGIAFAKRATGPFVLKKTFACPTNGDWALDPEVFKWLASRGGDNGFYVTYRDDYAARASGLSMPTNTAITTIKVSPAGDPVWGKHQRTMLLSSDMTWDERPANLPNHQQIIENPSLIDLGGRWYLFFSGNNYSTQNYATGIADCGSAKVAPDRARTGAPGNRCVQVAGTNRPYFGYSGRQEAPPFSSDPQISAKRGPGSMSVFWISSGGGLRVRVTWTALPDVVPEGGAAADNRQTYTGRLSKRGRIFGID
jgi:hypothetical protein